MDNIILALGCNEENKIEQVAVGTVPWSGIRIFDLSMISPDFSNFKNAYIGFDGTLINKNDTINHYTKYSSEDGRILNKAYHVLVKSLKNGEKIVLVTDGITSPKWIKLSDLYSEIKSGEAKLANAKIRLTGKGLDISGIKSEIEETNFQKFQMATRSYFDI